MLPGAGIGPELMGYVKEVRPSSLAFWQRENTIEKDSARRPSTYSWRNTYDLFVLGF